MRSYIININYIVVAKDDVDLEKQLKNIGITESEYYLSHEIANIEEIENQGGEIC